MRHSYRLRHVALALALALPALSFAAGEHAGGHGGHGAAGQESAAGRPGDAAKASRTISVEMDDTMRFTPGDLTVTKGETIRFLVINKGRVAHEMVIGSAAEIEAHAAMMKQMPGMKHEDANQVNLASGKRGGLVWTFDKPGTFNYACLEPGHKEAGMVGKIVVN